MRKALPGIVLLGCCFTLAVMVEPRWSETALYSRHQKGPIEVLLGDARRFFAGYFFTKADIYFHSGFYPSIFDQASKHEGHASVASGAITEEEELKSNFLGENRDWIDRFSRSFYPSRHTHLNGGGAESCTDHDHDHDHGEHENHESEENSPEMREILPWLRIAADLDPNRIETFTVGAFWLRTRMNKSKEAEQFLREGLRENPGSYAILFELGRIFHEDHKDARRARTVWEHALRKWNEQESGKPEPDIFLHSQIVWQLALVEQESGNVALAIAYLQTAKRVSPHPEAIEQRIAEMRAGL